MTTFHAIVAQLTPEQRRECAAEFEVAVSTVDRWAKGPKAANPHPRLKQQIVSWVRKRIAN